MPAPPLPCLPLLLVATFGATAHAGTVVVQTTVATEVSLDGLPVVRTYGPGTVSLPDIPAGDQRFTVFRDGHGLPVTVAVPETGRVRLMVGQQEITTDTPPPPAASEGPPPVLELRGKAGQRFSVILDGERLAVLGPDRPLRLESVAAGAHTVEFRSPDNLTIWARGSLELRAGDDVALSIAEGRPVEAFGRTDAWQANR
jgi:hypothetical protein